MTAREMSLMIYAEYPRHVGREAALKAIEKAVARLVKDKDAKDPLEARRTLWRAAKAYSESPAGRNPDRSMIPHPATWFNRGSYMDDPSEWEITGGDNGKTGHSIDAARAAILEIEFEAQRDRGDARALRGPQTIEAGQGRLQGVRERSGEV